jgi:hypothetical protein
MVCLALWAESSALALEHHEHSASDHCCLLCHVGPLPLLQTSVSAAAVPVLPVAWVAFAVEFQSAHDVLIATSSSRAPPA